MTYRQSKVNLNKSLFDFLQQEKEQSGLSFDKDMYCAGIFVNIDEEVQEPSYYRNVINAISDLQEDQHCTFRINSPGGNASGALYIMSALKSSNCISKAIIMGECHSAASILALNTNEVQVLPNASMLVHNASTGYDGKLSDIKSFADHQKVFFTDIVRSTYSGFLTEKELQETIEGREFWFNSEEIQRRLLNKRKFILKGEASVGTKSRLKRLSKPVPDDLKKDTDDSRKQTRENE